MTTKKYLGLFWDSQGFHFAESEGAVPKKLFSAQFRLLRDIALSGAKETADGTKLADIIPKTLRDYDVSESSVSLSLPMKDILFRTFLIPWMQSSEVRGVVEFEAQKYVPFNLDDLAFTHYPIIIQEKTRKQILVLFVAVKKDVLENYCSVLDHAGLRVTSVEPGPLSLVRALFSKKQFHKKQTTAVIEVGSFTGRIIIVNEGIPQFFREFQLSLPNERGTGSLDTMQIRLFNEIRVSLDYYSRQHPSFKVDRFLFVAEDNAPDLSQNLGDYFKLPIQFLPVSHLIKGNIATVSILKAYGASLRNSVLPNVNFNIPRATTGVSEEQVPLEDEKPNYTKAIVTTVLCVAVLGFVFHWTKTRISSSKIEAQTLTAQLGKYEASSVADITQFQTQITDRLTQYKNIRLKSQMSLFLTLVPQLLPDGVWLRDFAINTKNPNDGSLSVTLSGYAYLEDPNQQINLVNTLIDALKTNKEFSKNFKNIRLISVSRQNLMEYSVTTFNIECS